MFLGVDGGGTKTAFVLIDRHGNILARQNEPTSNYLEVGMPTVKHILAQGINAVLQTSNKQAGDIEHAFFGLPCYGEDSLLQTEMDSLPSGLVAEGHYTCHNDMVCGWAGALACQEGISVVSGTGAIVYGERHGLSARCSGWGELFGDEGSGYWIAQRGLALFARMSDGRVAKGPLYDLFRENLDFQFDLDLCKLVHDTWQAARSKVASVAPLVFKAAAAGDQQAEKILSEATDELALAVNATRAQLGFEATESVPVSYSGSVLMALGESRFGHALSKFHAKFSLQSPALPPDIGAAIYAAYKSGQPLTETAVQRLKSA